MDGGFFNNGIQMPVQLQKVNEPVNWQHYRIQAAIAAMNIVNGAYNIHNDMERLVRHSVKLADALIAELQKRKKNKMIVRRTDYGRPLE